MRRHARRTITTLAPPFPLLNNLIQMKSCSLSLSCGKEAGGAEVTGTLLEWCHLEVALFRKGMMVLSRRWKNKD